MKKEYEEHQGRKWSEDERDKPKPDILPADARLVDHPDEQPDQQAGIVQDDPLGGVCLEDACALRRTLEEEDS
ncbi:MAG: hypothetical protein AB7L09_10305 [Nitrospira sp.]